MTAPDIDSLFNHLDNWRHLPSYRLEPRADVFFGMFLPRALDRHLASRGIKIDPRLIPEFPLGQSGTKRSDKADFFALSTDRKHAFLIELKTDMRSLRKHQEDYLACAVKRGMPEILCDVRRMAKARERRAREKYFHLLRSIACLGLMTLPDDLEHKIYESPRGVYECLDRTVIASPSPSVGVIHVLPQAIDGKDCIDFETFARVVENQSEIGKRFAESLRNWTRLEAGEHEQKSPPPAERGASDILLE